MVSTNRTFSRSRTFRKLIFCIFWYIVPCTLFFMTRLTKMCVSPAKPLGSWATILAFELNKILSMFRAVLYWNVTTVWTNKLFLIKTLYILLVIHCLSTVFTSSKIRILTFIAHKVCIYGHWILIRFIVIRRILLCELLILITLLKF